MYAIRSYYGSGIGLGMLFVVPLCQALIESVA